MSARTSVETKSFMQGLVTEATPLDFPDGASLVDQNFEMTNKGARKRRNGFRRHPLSATFSGSLNTNTIPDQNRFSTCLWENAGEQGDTKILVVQAGVGALGFRLADQDGITTGLNVVNSPSLDPTRPLYFTTIQNKLVVTGVSEEVYFAEYIDGVVVWSSGRIQVRDRWGQDTGQDPSERVDEQEFNNDQLARYYYNMLNNGWPFVVEVDNERWIEQPSPAPPDPPDTVQVSPVFLFAEYADEIEEPGSRVLPAETDVWTFGKVATGSAAFIGTWSPETFLRNAPTPPGVATARGKFVIDVFARGQSRRDRASQLLNPAFSGLSVIVQVNRYRDDKTEGFVGACTTYSGRVFYALRETGREDLDPRSPSINNLICFTETFKGKESLTRCHAELDPTDLDNGAEPLDSDGGFIVIPEAGNILSMATVSGVLFVICDNGVWEVSGGPDTPFSATSLSIRKVTNTGAVSPTGVINADTLVSYVSREGIKVLSVDPRAQAGVVEDLTTGTIRSYFKDYPVERLEEVRGKHFEELDQVRWLFRRDDEDRVYFTEELVYEMRFNAFRVNTYKREAGIRDYVSRRRGVELMCEQQDNEEVGRLYHAIEKAPDANTDRFRDFDLEEEDSVLVTGDFTGGAPSSEKQVGGHFVVHLGKTEDGWTDTGDGYDVRNESSCLAQSRWGWHISDKGNKWGPEQQVYRLPRFYTPSSPEDDYDIGNSVITTKNRLRGRGQALSLRFRSEPEKDLILYGWGLEWRAKRKY